MKLKLDSRTRPKNIWKARGLLQQNIWRRRRNIREKKNHNRRTQATLQKESRSTTEELQKGSGSASAVHGLKERKGKERKEKEESTLFPGGNGGGRKLKEEFEIWWKEYPSRRKKKKQKCLEIWMRLAKAKRLPSLEEMLFVLDAQKKSQDWTKAGGEFIPRPEPYLNGYQFQDESILPTKEEEKEPDLYPDPDCPLCFGCGVQEVNHRGKICSCLSPVKKESKKEILWPVKDCPHCKGTGLRESDFQVCDCIKERL